MAKKLKQIVSTQAFSPVSDVKGGIVITRDGRYVKILEFSSINFSLLSASDQEGVTDSYGAALKNFPNNTQIKIVSKRADVEEYLRKLASDQRNETNEKCRQLQYEQMQLIEMAGATQGVARRFFVIFSFEPDAGSKKNPSFDQIRWSLMQQAENISRSLLSCGNTLISNDSDEWVQSVLYLIFSRSKSETMTLQKRKADVLANYADTYFTEMENMDEDSLVIPVNDLIAPEYIDPSISPTSIRIDGLYYMFCYLPSEAYPTRAYSGWMQLLINLFAGVDLDIYIKKENTEVMSRYLQNFLRINDGRLYAARDTDIGYEGMAEASTSGRYLKQGLASGDEFCWLSTLLTITAHSEKELQWKWKEIRALCVQNDMVIKQYKFHQIDGLLSTLPVCRMPDDLYKKTRRNCLASDLAAGYPFCSFELYDKGGIMLGENSSNQSLVFINPFDRNIYVNGNMVWVGTSGAGKTFAAMTMALRLRYQNTQTFTIAPYKGYEFERACDAIGGQFIRIEPGSPQNINIMEIRQRNTDSEDKIRGQRRSQTSTLSKKIQTLHAFISIILQDITHEERHLLDEALIRTYASFGITTDNDSLWDPQNPGHYREMPVLGDLYAQLEKGGPAAKRLRDCLSRFVIGSAKSFNQPTNVELTNKFIVIDVSNLTKEMLPLGMFIAFDFVMDRVKEDRTERKAVMLDEAWRLLGRTASQQAAEFVVEGFRTARGMNAIFIALSQNSNDFFASDYGKEITNTAKFKVLMKVEPEEIALAKETMHLTESECKQVKRFERGDGLLMANANHVAIHIVASETEHDLLSTDEQDLIRIQEKNMQKKQ